MPQHDNHQKESEGSISLLDRVGAALADRAAGRWSRRSAVMRLAQATAGLFGIAFTASFIVDSGFRVQAQNNANGQSDGCKQDRSKGGRCGAAGTWCALKGRSCDHFSGCSGCVQTTGNSAGCPSGTSLGGSWSACCLCMSELNNPAPRKGKMYTFKDCCGPLLGPVSSQCSPCYGNPLRSKNRDCENNRCPITQDWCSGYPGFYVCSIAALASEDEGGGDCTETRNTPPTGPDGKPVTKCS